jgi:hypothetical protein
MESVRVASIVPLPIGTPSGLSLKLMDVDQ